MFSSGSLLHSSQYQASTPVLSELRAAGLATSVTQTAKDALTWSSDRPATPEHLRPYQHYARRPPGSITRNPAAVKEGDSTPSDRVFGCKTKASKESAAECMALYPDSEIGRWKLEQSETVYASVRKEPLGHSPSRGYNLPEGLGTTIPCGRPLHVQAQEAANSTQAIIFPRQSVGEDEQTHQMYLQSHHSFEPGEQRVRDYDWSKANIDPRSHRFGVVDKRGQQCSVKQIMQPDLDEGVQQRPPVVSAIYDQHKATLGDTLGRPRVLGASPGSRMPPGHVFGKPSAREQEPCVGELIRGSSSSQQEAQLVDPGLSKSLTRWRYTKSSNSNNASSGSGGSTAERVFGLPSVRNDVHLPASPSVANTQNYGNEPTAYQLLTPPKCIEVGVKEEHLLQPRGRQEMRELMGEAGIGMGDDEFEAVFGLAAGGCVQGEAELEHACVSLEEFMVARQHYLRQCVGLA